LATAQNKTIVFTVLVGALGYFVDIYDLLLFGIVRMPSLRAIGIPEDQLMSVGLHLLNMQMTGLLLGGILWGILGDKRGRKSVMFGSILLYSLCNIANAFVADAETYAWLRLFAGIGLAGELGAAITLVAEIMPKETRGYGTAIVASVGILGAVFGAMIGDFFSWKIAYLVGGGMGLGLLILRAGLVESGMFKAMVKSTAPRGQFHRLFLKRDTFLRYLCCILIGVPIWFVIGILVTFAPELSRELGVVGTVTASSSIMWSYLGLSVGDLTAGLMSQWLKSRKKAVMIYLVATALLIVFYVYSPPMSSTSFYLLCIGLGLATGYWATFITIGAEQFGTNIRATVATTIPNFVRGSVVPMVFALGVLRPQLGLLNAVMAIGLAVCAMAFIALYWLQETFNKSLDYQEVD
jgi:MFS transporter, putative metabolite:H+ symporter